MTEFEQIEEILENYGLVETDEILSKHEALKYLENHPQKEKFI